MKNILIILKIELKWPPTYKNKLHHAETNRFLIHQESYSSALLYYGYRIFHRNSISINRSMKTIYHKTSYKENKLHQNVNCSWDLILKTLCSSSSILVFSNDTFESMKHRPWKEIYIHSKKFILNSIFPLNVWPDKFSFK